MLQFLGDVNLFHGRFGHTPGATEGEGEVSYVRPHELQVLGTPEPGTLPVTLSQTLTVGPQTRLEFKRLDEGGYVDVELPRAEYARLREQLALSPGKQVFLKPRRLTRFTQGAVQEEQADPAAMI